VTGCSNDKRRRLLTSIVGDLFDLSLCANRRELAARELVQEDYAEDYRASDRVASSS
jgi:hypothetical protein